MITYIIAEAMLAILAYMAAEENGSVFLFAVFAFAVLLLLATIGVTVWAIVTMG